MTPAKPNALADVLAAPAEAGSHAVPGGRGQSRLAYVRPVLIRQRQLGVPMARDVGKPPRVSGPLGIGGATNPLVPRRRPVLRLAERPRPVRVNCRARSVEAASPLGIGCRVHGQPPDTPPGDCESPTRRVPCAASEGLGKDGPSIRVPSVSHHTHRGARAYAQNQPPGLRPRSRKTEMT